MDRLEEEQRLLRRWRREVRFVMIGFSIIVIVCFVLAIIDLVRRMKAQKPAQFSVSGAALLPNPIVTQNKQFIIVTADFNFTLNAYNPNKKKTIFYGNTTQVTLSYWVSRSEQPVIATTSFIGPTSLPPRNSSDMAINNIHIQNVALPLESNDEGDTVYYFILTMTFMAGFDDKESNHRQVSVECSYLSCSFPKGFTGDYGTCSTS